MDQRTETGTTLPPDGARPAAVAQHLPERIGCLRHPGIAQSYEAGTDDSGQGPQPCFAMDLIRGLTLVRHADENRLDLRRNLDLVARVCDAVQHAHQQ